MSESQPVAGGYVTLQIVAAGNGWWISSGPDPSDISTYVFLDCAGHLHLLDLPGQLHNPGWSASAAWSESGDAIQVAVSGPTPAWLEIRVDRPELEAVRRARRLFVCPTTPALGLSPFLARDRSFVVELPRRSNV